MSLRKWSCAVHCVLCTVQCALCTVHCVLCTVHCEVCTVHCALWVCSVHCALCIVHCATPLVPWERARLYCTNKYVWPKNLSWRSDPGVFLLNHYTVVRGTRAGRLCHMSHIERYDCKFAAPVPKRARAGVATPCSYIHSYVFKRWRDFPIN